ncbi:MAG: BON domain-containing protein, partial [Pseudomonadota bacterium]|nr:BON domain-containing protein [Pseudomonadota bacterium]
MGLMSFMKEAGEKLFGKGEAQAAEVKAKAEPTPENVAALSKAAGTAIENYVVAQGLKVDGLDVAFDAPASTVTVSGTVADQATKEKVLLCCGNVHGVEKVNDMLTVSAPAPESRWHT